jgi:hypothetical protein
MKYQEHTGELRTPCAGQGHNTSQTRTKTFCRKQRPKQTFNHLGSMLKGEHAKPGRCEDLPVSSCSFLALNIGGEKKPALSKHWLHISDTNGDFSNYTPRGTCRLQTLSRKFTKKTHHYRLSEEQNGGGATGEGPALQA